MAWSSSAACEARALQTADQMTEAHTFQMAEGSALCGLKFTPFKGAELTC